ncbi:MAG: carbohydrate ABC transporter permease [Lachnospiraceae bacterium]|nr:carbohydrate ABC transporter permease [Lachnospiraceae bacterium]
MKELFADAKNEIMDPYRRNSYFKKIKKFLEHLMCFLIIVGVSYVIVAPVIGMFVNSISSTKDAYDPMMFIFPKYPTLEKYSHVIMRMDYWKTIGRDLAYVAICTLIQLFVCSMVGYGFARFDFPFKKILFGCVVVMIVIPAHTIMLPLYITFRQFDPFGIFTKLTGEVVNLMGTPLPMVLLTVLGCGVRSGLYIYIFNQFFRGLPKEIEEAALVDGAGLWYTYFRIMLVNAMPSVITVTVFSVVWQFNDTFYANLFQIKDNIVISKKIATLASVIANQDKILEVPIQQLYIDAGIILIIVPIILIYVILQRRFIEGVERSGIVG